MYILNERPREKKVRMLRAEAAELVGVVSGARTVPCRSNSLSVLTPPVFLLLPQPQVPNEKASTAKVCIPAAAKTGSS